MSHKHRRTAQIIRFWSRLSTIFERIKKEMLYKRTTNGRTTFITDFFLIDTKKMNAQNN